MTDTMKTELKPCPFCGGSAHMMSEHDADEIVWRYVVCRKCGARSRGKWHSPGNDDPQFFAEVREEWNARAALDSQAAQAQPSGWKLVPIEPTEEMLRAYLAANTAYWQRTDGIPTPPNRWRTGRPTEATYEGYRAMIAASPSHSKEPGDGAGAAVSPGADVQRNEGGA